MNGSSAFSRIYFPGRKLALCLFLFLAACAPRREVTYEPLGDGKSFRYKEMGIASWYGPEFQGRRTSSGEVFNMYQLTAALKYLEHGKHVLVEKPMAMNAQEAGQMCEAAEKSGALLMVAHCWRFHPEVQWLNEQSAKLGKIIRTKAYAVHVHWGPSGWFAQKQFAGGGAMADMGVHALDTTRYLLGDPQPFRQIDIRMEFHHQSAASVAPPGVVPPWQSRTDLILGPHPEDPQIASPPVLPGPDREQVSGIGNVLDEPGASALQFGQRVPGRNSLKLNQHMLPVERPPSRRFHLPRNRLRLLDFRRGPGL